MLSTGEVIEGVDTDFVTVNGLRLEVDRCGDQQSRRLALCLHGFPEHSVSWRFQMPMLAALGFKVWAPNMRGYGNSSIPPDMSDYSLENLMADVAGLIDAADCDEVTLIAHDWGAIIAWYFAMREIRPLKQMIICNVPHPAAMQAAMGRQQWMKSWYAIFFQIPSFPEWLMKQRRVSFGAMMRDASPVPSNYPDEVVRIYDENGRRPGGLTAMLNYYRALVRGRGAERQRDRGMPVIKTPTLMLWGEDDVALTIETTYGTEKWVEDLTIRYLPRISHWVQQDAPEEVNAMMSAFIQGESVPYMEWESKLVQRES